MNAPDSPKVMPKGGRKGGAMYPRVTLKDAIGYARKLVNKTHIGPQPRDVIMSGVVGATSGIGNVRISALKQYGLLSGDEKIKYSATDLAKSISSAIPDELNLLYRKSALKPNIFAKIFNTFHGDGISRAKLRQRAAQLDVHPEQLDDCVDVYLATMQFAELIQLDGEVFRHIALDQIDSNHTSNSDQGEGSGVADASPEAENEEELDSNGEDVQPDVGRDQSDVNRPRAIFNVSINLDSSLDTDKLERQLSILKKFGAI